MNLVLIGYRGTGKSAVAEILSRKLGMPAVSLDEEIVREAGMPIPEIVEKRGWPWFRDLEAEIAERFAARDGAILDTGGGVILRPDNTEKLRRNGVLFWLKASVDVIVQRIQESTQRPSLTEGRSFLEEVEEVLSQRLPLYQAAADREIDTDPRTVSEVAEEIIRAYRALAAERGIAPGDR
jgi:shikimate kinase